ncbi:hypothetical protein PNOK_0440800 [Pyrrhoderma noxium]|uniref:Uncharacterized protein n=1 Tax=Pyrrhoderma noxium TaxID=2282107 RepID=A0A286UJ25_9AGAM|nr:hypothetical protein PNOK_0440800 [Pyrrhoderma noxium]
MPKDTMTKAIRKNRADIISQVTKQPTRGLLPLPLSELESRFCHIEHGNGDSREQSECYANKKLTEAHYKPKSGESVLVRTRTPNTWALGKVEKSARPQTLTNGSLGYLVYYKVNNHKMRRYCSPVDGEIIPDNIYYQDLLKREGCILIKPTS